MRIRSLLLVSIFVLTAGFAAATTASAEPAAPDQRAPADSVKQPDSDGLGPSSDVPWNPPKAIAPRQPWEQVVLLPGRIVSLPLSGLGYIVKQSLLYLEDSGRLSYGGGLAGSKPALPVGVAFPHFGDRAGLGGALEFRSDSLLRHAPRATLRIGGSLHKYSSTLAGISQGPIAIQYGYDWQPEQQFYGFGSTASRDSLADFGSQDEFARGVLKWGGHASSATRGRGVTFSAWGGPRSLVTRTGRADKQVSYDVRFPALAATTLDRRVENLVYGAALGGDWRTGRPHWSHGGRIQAGFERFDVPVQGLALHTSRADGAQFTRFSGETEAGVSFMRDPRTVRVLLKVADVDVGSGRDRFLFSDLSRLGGRDGLGGYALGRFRDMDMILGRLTYVFPLARLFEFEAHSEWGSVYPDVWKDASLRTLKSSVGFSLRSRTAAAPHGALGMDFSREGMRISYALGGVE